MVRIFPKSVNQPNEKALTICNSISHYCFRLMRDWKLDSLANGKEISAVPFQTEKEEYLCRYSTIFERNFRKNYLTICLQTEISGFSGQMVSTRNFLFGRRALIIRTFDKGSALKLV